MSGRAWRRLRGVVMAQWGDAAARQIAWVFGSQMAGLALGLVSSALLARSLGPEGLSAFTVVGAAIMIASTVADLGLSNSAVRFIAAAPEPEHGQAVAMAFVQWKWLGAGLGWALLMVLAAPVARLLKLPGDAGVFWVRLGSIGLLTLTAAGIISTLQRSLHRFRAFSATQFARASLIVVFMAALFAIGKLTVVWALIVGPAAALVAAGLGYVWLPKTWRLTVHRRPSLRHPAAGDMLRFSRWLWVSAILSILLSQLDVLLLNRLLAPAFVGYYALAANLAAKVDTINQAAHTVLLPMSSALDGRRAYLDHLRRGLIRSALVGLGVLAFLPLARPFVLLVYGQAFASSVAVFYALLAVIVLDLLTIPLLVLAFPLHLPRLIVVADVAGIVLLAGLSLLLVPVWGMYGVVAAKLAAKMGSALILGSGVAWKLRDKAG